MLTRRDLGAAILAALAAVAGLYALAQIRWDVPPLAWPFLAGVLLGTLVGFRAGQYARGFAHSRGIWRSHKAAIRGGHR